MERYRIAVTARLDLGRVWAFTASVRSVAEADLYYENIQKCIERIVASPSSAGRHFPQTPVELRGCRCGEYVIFYTTDADGIPTLRRIFHESLCFSNT